MIRQFKKTFQRSRLRRESMSAVHDDDLASFLASIGALHDISSGKIRCKFCKETINLENLQAAIPDSGTVSFICNKPQCLKDLIQYTKEGS